MIKIQPVLFLLEILLCNMDFLLKPKMVEYGILRTLVFLKYIGCIRQIEQKVQSLELRDFCSIPIEKDHTQGIWNFMIIELVEILLFIINFIFIHIKKTEMKLLAEKKKYVI